MSTVQSDVPGVSVPALERYVRETLPDLLRGPLQVQLLSGGRSNLTYSLTDGHRRWVLRRPPLGHVLATAHDMDREHRVLRALCDTEVPVPRPVLIAPAEVLGAPFYVMEFADGEVLRGRAQLETFAAPAARQLGQALIDVLVRLHRVDPAAVGLGDLGRPDGYLQRQLVRWRRQLDASRSRVLPQLDSLGDRLANGLPRRQPTSLVHGDYRLDNVVVDRAGGGVVAVLDWEMATQGDPLADLASTAIWWDGMAGLDNPVAVVPGDVSGFASSAELVDRYGRQTGRDLDEFSWYCGFAYYKIAAIFEGIHCRMEQGLTVGDGFDRLGALVTPLAQRGHAVLDSASGWTPGVT